MGRRARPTARLRQPAGLPPGGARGDRYRFAHGPRATAGAAADGDPAQRRFRDAGYARDVAGEIYGGSLRGRPDLVERLVLADDSSDSVRSYLYQLGAGLGWTSIPMLPLIRQPTLVLAGSDDPIIPLVNARIMTRLLPDARLHVYDEGHLGILSSARELAGKVSDFLTA